MDNKKIKIEKSSQYTTWYKFMDKNKKGESLVVEISETHPDNKSKSSLPNLWLKHGFTNKLYSSYLNVDCYCYDKKGNEHSRYNPTTKLSDDGKRMVIDFDYLLEVSEENKQYLLDLIYKMFMKAKNTIK